MKQYILLALLLAFIGCTQDSKPEINPPTASQGTLQGKIVQYFDFDCPYCRQAALTLSALKKENPDVNIELRHFVIHPRVTLAHEALECAKEQGKMFDFFSSYFEKHFGASSSSELKQVAESVDLNINTFDGCLAQGRQKILNQEKKIGILLGVSGTPHFIVNDQKHFNGAVSAETLKSALE